MRLNVSLKHGVQHDHKYKSSVLGAAAYIFSSDALARSCIGGKCPPALNKYMSRVAHCIDNGPMEGFWGILKREMYYGKKFTSKGDLITAVESYIRYYNTERTQRKLHLMTPAEFHDHFDAAA